MKKRIWQFVAGANPRLVILFSSLLLLLAAWFTFQIRFSYDYEDFFPRGDSDLDFYYEFREKFEHDDNFLMIGFNRQAGILDSDFLSRLDSATIQLDNIAFADRSYSISNFRYFIRSPFGYIDYPALHIGDESRYAQDSARISLDERIIGKLITPDFRTCIILIKTSDTLRQENSYAFIDDVKSVLEKNGLTEYHLLGKSNFQVELVKIQRFEFLLYATLSIILVSIVTFLMFRSLWCVLLCLITVGASLLLFTGIIGLLGFEQNIMSTLFPIVIIIIGISDAVHFLSKYISELSVYAKNTGDAVQSVSDRKIALENTLKDIGSATFLTAVTSAIGFLTMITSNVPPLKLFGVFAGLGVMIAYGVSLFITSPLLKYFSYKQLRPRLNNKNRDIINWPVFLHKIYLTGKNHPRRILFVIGILMLVSGFGILQISTDIHIGAGLPKNARVTKDFEFFEQNFNGFRPFEIAAIAQGDYHINDPDVLMEIDLVESFVKRFEIINGVQSITMVYKSLNRAWHGDDPQYYTMPDTADYATMQRDLDRIRASEINVLISEDKKYGRISGFLSDAGTDSIQSVQHKIRSFISENTDPGKVQFEITGTGIIFDKNTDYLRRNIISGVLLAFLSIGLLMALMFKNWRMALISIVPNIIPLFFCAGIMGLTGIELDAPTSIIFGISYGIAVDDTIHFLSKFRIELRKGLPLETAIKNTFEETGKAVFIMSVILLFGFSILMVSRTAATFNIGLLTGVTLFSAVWPDMLLLPVLLRSRIKWKKKK